MKRMILLAGLLAAVLFGQDAMATMLEDILKEKGIITDSEYEEATKSKPVDYTPGRGFTLMTPDELFKLQIGMQLTVRETYTDYFDSSKTNDNELRLRNSRFFMRGNVFSKDITYYFRTNFSDSATPSKIVQLAWINYKLLDEVQFTVGDQAVPFTRQFLMPPWEFQLTDLSDATNTFYAGYDTGAQVWGRIKNGLLVYNLGVFGGVGAGVLRSTNNAAYVGRLTFNPLGDFPYSEADIAYTKKPLFSVGVDYFYDKLKNTFTPAIPSEKVELAGGGTYTIPGQAASSAFETNNYNLLWLAKEANHFTITEEVAVYQWSVDSAFKWRGFFAQAEFFGGRAQGTVSDIVVSSYGYYGQAGYFIIPHHLEVAARYSYVEPNSDVGNDQHREIQGCISYYFYGHNLKLQAQYTNIDDKISGSGNQYILQANLVF